MTLADAGYDIEYGDSGDLFTQVSAVAVFDPSGDRRYRYQLTYTWDPDTAPVVFCMLNPSTATALTVDNTITRCLGFARALGAGGLVVVNLFAWRATDPRDLRAAADPVGPDNTRFILDATSHYPYRMVIAAWGADPMARDRGRDVHHLLRLTGPDLYCLGTTKDGAPRHPLYLPKHARPVRFTPVR